MRHEQSIQQPVKILPSSSLFPKYSTRRSSLAYTPLLTFICPPSSWREGRPQSLNAPPQQQKQQQQRQPPQPVQAQADRAKASASPRPSSHGRIPSSSAPQNRGPQSTSQAGNAGNTWVGPGDKNRAAATTAATPVEEKKMKGPAVAFNGEEVRAFLRRGKKHYKNCGEIHGME